MARISGGLVRAMAAATLAAVPPATAAATLAAVPPAMAVGHAAAASYPSPHLAAPYLQIDASDAGDMAADMAATGLADYRLAFLTPVSPSSCTPMWEDGNLPMARFTPQVHALQASGGDVIVSFGGAAGGDLAQSCTSVDKLEAAYARVLATYGITRLDFDVEGSVLSDTGATSRRNRALAALQAADPAVQVDFTLPVAPSGLTARGLQLVEQAKRDGVAVHCVNIMTMDFGNGQDVLADAESAGTATERQLAKAYPALSASQVWGMIGMTPIAGKNDDEEDFTVADAHALEAWAAARGVGLLAFWELDADDKPLGYQYSAIFEQITS